MQAANSSLNPPLSAPGGSTIRDVLMKNTTKELLERMTPEKQAIYSRIVELRDKIGPVKMNIGEAVRELREDG